MSLPGVAAVSSALVAYHLLLTRHAAFLFEPPAALLTLVTVPLGLAVGALLPRRAAGGATSFTAALALAGAAALLALVAPARPAGLALLGALPFVAGGFCLADAYRQALPAAGRVYLATLLGGAAGALLALPVLRGLGPLAGAAALASLPLAAGLASRERVGRGGLIAFVAVAALLAAASARGWEERAWDALDPGKALAGARAAAEPVWRRWSGLGRSDLLAPAGEPDRFWLYLDGRGPVHVPGTGVAVGAEASFLPWVGANPGRALVAARGGAREVAGALAAGFQEVVALEADPRLASLYPADPRVTVLTGEGRSGGEGQFDVIYLPVSQPAAPGAGGLPLARTYTYTVQAFRRYFDLLAPGGRIALVLRNEAESWKVIRAALTVLEERGTGLPDALRHLTLIAGEVDGIRRPFILVTPGPLGEKEGLALLSHVFTHGGVPSFIPGAVQAGALQWLLEGSLTLEQLLDLLPFDSRPVTDDRPFFWQFEPGLPLLARASLLAATMATAVLLAGTYVFGRRQAPGPIPVLLACAAGSFFLSQAMIVEKAALLAGCPAAGNSLALAGFLAGAGLGGYAGALAASPLRQLRGLLGAAAAVLAVVGLAGDACLVRLLGQAPPVRLALAFFLPAVLGLLPGAIVAGSFRLLGPGREGLAPALGAIAAAAGCLGAAGAAVLAVSCGFGRGLLVAAPLYLAALVVSAWRPRP